MKKKFPELKQYAQDWPAKCLLQAHLKVTVDAAKIKVTVVKPSSTKKLAPQVRLFS
jgi:hypothetical protein